jgi:hypothetical protein
MTEVNGLRLAYRGLVAGLAAGWVWLAISLAGLLAIGVDPIGAVRSLGHGGPAWSAIAAVALAQVTAGLTGLFFAYFFGRYFTVRITLAVSATAFALLAWLAAANLAGAEAQRWSVQVVLAVASLAYGAMLGSALPVRGEVLRGSSTT